jgi:phosphoadenosine phosphosulfate reductase
MEIKFQLQDGKLSRRDIIFLNEQIENLSAEEILLWTWETFGTDAIASSSFQTQSTPLLHMISQVCPKLPIIFIDTGFHFPETLVFRDQLQARYDLNVQIVHPEIEKSQLFEKHGEGLYRRDPELCCYINKVKPMKRALAGKRAWITGIRRDQTEHRENLSVFEMQDSGILKVHPLISWAKRDLWKYIETHDLPTHPLFSKGYQSIGCAPCTRPVIPGEDERSGRWAEIGKTECGLHTMNDNEVENGETPR